MTHYATILRIVLTGAIALPGLGSARAEQPTPPADPGLTEQVEVRLVLVDTLAIDRKGRSVADLTRDDFELFVDYAPHAIDSLDRVCPGGATDDPRAVSRPGETRPAVAPQVPRRLVLAVDYMHLRQVERVEVIERLREAVAGVAPGAEEIMLAAITGDLRVEQIFTGDREAVLAALLRMENDISLWLPAFDHLHELRFFRSLDELVDLLGLVPGSKAVVLYSNLPGPSASYDLAFERVASKAALSRVAFYPVLARGLSQTSSPRLARLAVETGGRFTENTNDLSLGYARAQRDLSCRYVLGFYDANADRGRARRVSVRIRRPGVRAVHPNNYEFPTTDQEQDSRLRSALIAPEMFPDAGVRAGFFPLFPAGPRRWEGLLAVGLPVDARTPPGGRMVREVAARLRSGSRVAQSFQHSVTVAIHGTPRAGDHATHRSIATARPGDYTLSAAVSDPGAPLPAATRAAVSLPPIPTESLFVVPPILGRRPPAAVEIQADASERGPTAEWPDFEPLFGSRVAPGNAELLVLTHVCSRGDTPPDEADILKRVLRAADGQELPVVKRDAPARPAGAAPFSCVRTVDRLATAELQAGDYVFDVTVTRGDAPANAQVTFSVGPPPQLH